MQGQINLGTPRGETIKNICHYQSEVKTIVEIGTWNDRGSTMCVLEGLRLRDNGEQCEFYTLEVNRARYEEAKEIDPHLPNVHFILGRIIEVEDFITDNFPPHQPRLPEWLPISIEDHKAVDNVLHRLPSKIDFLILDGGEVSTKAELSLLYDRCNYIFLDDTIKLKNIYNRQRLIDSPEFKLLIDEPAAPRGGHNGWSLFKRIINNEL